VCERGCERVCVYECVCVCVSACVWGGSFVFILFYTILFSFYFFSAAVFVLIMLMYPATQDVRIIAVETEGAASFAAAQKAGKPEPLSAITSIATSLGALAVTHGTLASADRIATESMVVSDKEAVRAMRRFADEQRVLVEPACGAALAGVYEPER
jgi:threonine dehydratase